MDSFKRYSSFSEFITNPIEDLIKEHENIKNLRTLLEIHSNNVRVEILANCRAYNSLEKKKNYLNLIHSKLRGLQKTIFTISDNISKEDPSIKRNKLYKLFIQEVCRVLDDLKPFVSTMTGVLVKENIREEIRSEVFGFKIRNQTNLLRAWRLLKNKENEFISSKVTGETFERNFTGKKIIKKIIWKGSDKSLHYFIDGIYGKLGTYGIGVEKVEGGQWEKASDCFCKEDGSFYEPGNLSRTKDPPKKDKEKLDIIINQMNKQPPHRKD